MIDRRKKLESIGFEFKGHPHLNTNPMLSNCFHLSMFNVEHLPSFNRWNALCWVSTQVPSGPDLVGTLFVWPLTGIGSIISKKYSIYSKKEETHHWPLIDARNWKASDWNSKVLEIVDPNASDSWIQIRCFLISHVSINGQCWSFAFF
jgi:hypothetical protein